MTDKNDLNAAWDLFCKNDCFDIRVETDNKVKKKCHYAVIYIYQLRLLYAT